MLNIFLIALPVFAIAGIGYLLSRFARLDFSKLSSLSIWLLAPCLAIYTLTIRKFDASMLGVALASFAVFALLWVISKLISRFSGLDSRRSLVLVSSSIMMNALYIGLPLCYLAFGTDGLAYGGVFATINSLVVYTYGVSAIGPKNSKGRLPEFLKVPLFYAAILAICLSLANIPLPSLLALPVEYIGKFDIFVGLMVLGSTLATADRKSFETPLLSLVSGLKLIVGPALAFAACALFGVSGIAQKAVILQSGMPVAVYTVILASRYKNESSRFAAAVLVSTLLSIITLSALLLVL